MNLTTAQAYAAKISAWLQPHCARLEIAGSIRRERPVCNDVDIVCIPNVIEERDMLGATIRRTNYLLQFLQEYVRTSINGARFQSGGEKEGKSVILQLPKCQLDIWFAEEKNFGTRLLCRTGSKEHNILLAQRAIDLGRSWNPYEGVMVDGQLRPAAIEQEVYDALKLPWIEPRDREGEFVARLTKSK
jgi:DNA polymerase (family 10)